MEDTNRSEIEHQVLDIQSVFQGRAFEVQQVRMRLPDGREVVYDLVKHPGAVTIVPVDEAGNIWFVRQYRVGVGKSLLELPAGTLELNEDPDVAAGREIREEIGMAAGSLQKLGEFYMAPGYSTEHMHVYLATGLRPDALSHDDDEFLSAEAIPAAQVYAMIAASEIQDGKSLAALQMARDYLDL